MRVCIQEKNIPVTGASGEWEARSRETFYMSASSSQNDCSVPWRRFHRSSHGWSESLLSMDVAHASHGEHQEVINVIEYIEATTFAGVGESPPKADFPNPGTDPARKQDPSECGYPTK